MNIDNNLSLRNHKTPNKSTEVNQNAQYAEKQI